MSNDRKPPVVRHDGYQPLNEGYKPQMVAPKRTVQGGYRPTTGRAPSTAPASVPRQPSSVQPPKK